VGTLPAVILVTVLPEDSSLRAASALLVETFNPFVTGLLTALDSEDVESGEQVVGPGSRLLAGFPAAGGGDLALEEVIAGAGAGEPTTEEAPTVQQFITGMQEALDRLDLTDGEEFPDTPPAAVPPVNSQSRLELLPEIFEGLASEAPAWFVPGTVHPDGSVDPVMLPAMNGAPERVALSDLVVVLLAVGAGRGWWDQRIEKTKASGVAAL
jgi:hypothetical protein